MALPTQRKTDLISLILDTINRPIDDEWTRIVSLFIDQAFNRVGQKLLDFGACYFIKLNSDEKGSNVFTQLSPVLVKTDLEQPYIELFLNVYNKPMKIKDLSLELDTTPEAVLLRGVSSGVVGKLGNTYYFNSNDVFGAQKFIRAVARRQANTNLDTNLLAAVFEQAFDYLYHEVTLRMMLYIRDDLDRVATEKALRDEAYYDLQNYIVKLGDTGILTIEG